MIINIISLKEVVFSVMLVSIVKCLWHLKEVVCKLMFNCMVFNMTSLDSRTPILQLIG